MKTSIKILCIGIILVAMGFSVLKGSIDLFAIGGIAFGILSTIGTLLFIGFILLIFFSTVGILLAGFVGLVGIVMLAIAFPFVAPILLVLLPVILLIKLIK